MKVVSQEDIISVLVMDEVIDAVKNCYISKENGNTSSPSPMQILFHNQQDQLVGDCHVKAAQDKESSYFAIKVASGFYENKNRSLPVNNGLTLLMSMETGFTEVLLNDSGLLTSLRTAAAGAIAASLARNISSNDSLGIIGTGSQALLQAEWVSHLLGIKNIAVLGRTNEASIGFAKKLNSLGFACEVVQSGKQLASQAKVIVTATPSTKAVLMSEDVPDGVHIVALGSDSPGKQELDPKLLERAEMIITDDHQQCLEHGEFGVAYRSSLVQENADTALGNVLSGKTKNTISGKGISVVDLTGLGAQDLAIAMLVWNKLK